MQSKFTAKLLAVRSEELARAWRVLPFLLLLLSVAILSIAISSAAYAQEPENDRPDPQAVLEIIKRIKSLEKDVETLRGGQKPYITLEDPHLGSIYAGNNKYEHFFVARLRVINLSKEAVQIKRDAVVLEMDGDEYKYGELKSTRSTSFQLTPNSSSMSLKQVIPVETLKVAPGASGQTMLRFAGMPVGGSAPKMKIRIAGESPVELDVNELTRKQLGLEVEQIGPRGSLAMLTVSGPLNPISAGSIVDELATLSEKKVVRAVIRFADGAPPLTSYAANWLRQSAAMIGQPNVNFSRSTNAYPTFPGGLRELHISSLPGSSTSSYSRYGSSTVKRIHKTDLEAVMAALQSAYERVPLPEVIADIESKNQLTRTAAIACGGGRLPIENLGMLLKLADDDEPEIQKAALMALGHFGEDKAVEKLELYVRKNVSPVSDTAITSLAMSRFPPAHKSLLGILKNETPPTRKRIVAKLASHPRTAWADAIFEFASDPNSGLVLESTKALAQIGHPKLVDLLASQLDSKNKSLQAEAFRQLSTRQDAKSEKLAVDYTLELMKTKPPTSTMLTLISRTRDARALPHMLRHFEKVKSNRQPLINAIAQIGDQSVVPIFSKAFPRLAAQDKRAILTAMASLDPNEYRKLAAESLDSSDSSLVSEAAKALQEDGSDESIKMLADAFISSSNTSHWSYLSRALQELRTKKAREELYRVGDSTENSSKLNYVTNALKSMDTRSPGYSYWNKGQTASQDGKYAEAIKEYNNSINADEGYSKAYSGRGYAYLKQEKYKEAITDFEKSLNLDSRNGLAKAGKSIALVEQGDVEEGVKQVEINAQNFKTDSLFAYNSCCVYGTAMKILVKEDPMAYKTETYKKYQKKALSEFARCLEMDFGKNQAELIHSDPDLDLLRDLKEYKDLIADIPKPEPKSKPEPEPKSKPTEDAKPEEDSPQAEQKEAAKPTKAEAVKKAAQEVKARFEQARQAAGK